MREGGRAAEATMAAAMSHVVVVGTPGRGGAGMGGGCYGNR